MAELKQQSIWWIGILICMLPSCCNSLSLLSRRTLSSHTDAGCTFDLDLLHEHGELCKLPLGNDVQQHVPVSSMAPVPQQA